MNLRKMRDNDTGFARVSKPMVVLLSGITGSGKSTFALKLAALGFHRVSIDELVFQAHGAYGKDYPEPEYPAFEREAMEVAYDEMRLGISAGFDVVYDHGLWNPSDRIRMHRMVERWSGEPVHVDFPVPRVTIENRLGERNRRSDANALWVTDGALDDFYARYVDTDGEVTPVINGTESFSAAVVAMRACCRRPAWTGDAVLDSVLDNTMSALRRCDIQVRSIHDDLLMNGADPLGITALTVTLENQFGLVLSPGEVLAAATPLKVAELLVRETDV